MDAAAAFFQQKPGMTHTERTQAYSTALEQVRAQSPGDVEIGAFYALSLVSLAEEDVDTTANLDWNEAARWPIPEIRKSWRDKTYWARAIGAARSGDIAGAESDVKELTKLVAEREKRAKKSGNIASTEKSTDLGEAEAWLALAKGKAEDALRELRAAADRQDKSGGESVGIPAREMLADMLLELKRPAEALAEYRTDLTNSPNRVDALYGGARAAQASGDTGGAQSLYAQLASICSPGADRPEVAEAKTYVARK